MVAAAAPSAGAIRLVAFDLDGVIWRGAVALPGVREVLGEVLRRGFVVRYVSNNSTGHRRVVSDRLENLGLPAGCERVLTSAFVTGRWLRARLPAGAPVMVVGETGLLEELTEAGLDPYHAGSSSPGGQGRHDPPSAVVVGMDRSFNFETLCAAHAAIRAGALFLATNEDPTFPTPEGEIPGAGSIVAAVATAVECRPLVMGKPGVALAEVLARSTGVPAEETMLVGDRLNTDIVMGETVGMTTVLVLTGVTGPEELQEGEARSMPIPDYVINDLPGLLPLLE